MLVCSPLIIWQTEGENEGTERACGVATGEEFGIGILGVNIEIIYPGAPESGHYVRMVPGEPVLTVHSPIRLERSLFDG